MSAIRQRAATAPGQREKDELLRVAGEKEERQLKESEKFVPPAFTIKQLLDAIPAHCFHRSALRSSLYIVQDVIAIAALSYGYFHVQDVVTYAGLPAIPSLILKAFIHSVIAFFTGLYATGLWVIAHECGHQAFSSSKQINNAVGWVLHSALLVPYHSWRISHGRHHAATGHLTRDEVFVPRTRSQHGYPEIKEEAEIDGISVSQQRQEELREAVNDAPLYILANLLAQQLVGWPMYLIRNASGQKHYPKFTNHFQPSSFIFKPEQKGQVIWSDFGLLITFAVLGYWGHVRGFSEVFYMYVIPYFWVNHWLVAITFLQHTDPLLPHYSANKWNFARGALCTIDRQFLGPLGAHTLHGICETHVAHHISSKIPHYSAWEATEAIKNFVGPYYMKSDENFLVSLFKNYRECRWIEDNGDVVFYKNASGVAQRVGVEDNGGVSDSGVDMSADK
jgi:omega-6 fatty acid desaturase (delta-12 desaturase)